MPNQFTKALIQGLLALLLALPFFAQEAGSHHHPSPVSLFVPAESHHDHGAHSHQADDEQTPNLARSYLLSLSSGTSLNPASWSMPFAPDLHWPRKYEQQLTHSSMLLQCRPSRSIRSSASLGPQVPAA
jgi:hypothetical protein